MHPPVDSDICMNIILKFNTCIIKPHSIINKLFISFFNKFGLSYTDPFCDGIHTFWTCGILFLMAFCKLQANNCRCVYRYLPLNWNGTTWCVKQIHRLERVYQWECRWNPPTVTLPQRQNRSQRRRRTASPPCFWETIFYGSDLIW